MQKWEYRIVYVSEIIQEVGMHVRQHDLNVYFGKEGWELVSVDNEGVAYFKRPIIEDKKC